MPHSVLDYSWNMSVFHIRMLLEFQMCYKHLGGQKATFSNPPTESHMQVRSFDFYIVSERADSELSKTLTIAK